METVARVLRRLGRAADGTSMNGSAPHVGGDNMWGEMVPVCVGSEVKSRLCGYMRHKGYDGIGETSNSHGERMERRGL